MIQIAVMGQPAPQGSKRYVGQSRAGRAILVESSAKVKPWRQDVAAAAQAFVGSALAMRDAVDGKLRQGIHVSDRFFPFPLDMPLRVRMVFTLPAPANLPKRRPSFASKKPDVSKLVRSTEDALTSAGLWRDDARVVECLAIKTYPSGTLGAHRDALPVPGCVIEVDAVRVP